MSAPSIQLTFLACLLITLHLAFIAPIQASEVIEITPQNLMNKKRQKPLCFPLENINQGLITLETPYPSLDLSNSTAIQQAPGIEDLWFVTNRFRKLAYFKTSDDKPQLEFLSNLGFKRGSFLGLALHPDFKNNGKIYISYIQLKKPTDTFTIYEVTFDHRKEVIEKDSQRVIASFDSPVDDPKGRDHHGGHMIFGPDGYLYFVIGDGHKVRLPSLSSQDLNTAFGKMLRIDVDKPSDDKAYSIPNDNPLVGKAGLDEIYAWGLRNFWKFEFQPDSNIIWGGDVGTQRFEELNRIEKAGNYGWPDREGNQDCPSTVCKHPRYNLHDEYIDPVISMSREEANSITGGFFYQGEDIPELKGLYIFGDFSLGRLWSYNIDTNEQQLLLHQPLSIVSFAQDHQGELYFIDFTDGTFYKLAAASKAAATETFDTLAQTRCVDMENYQASLGYTTPLYLKDLSNTNNLDKFHFAALPRNKQITVDQQQNLIFPKSSVLIQTLAKDNKPIETRLLSLNHQDQWQGKSYLWNSEQNDAVTISGDEPTTAGHQLLSAGECKLCHREQLGSAILQISQLDIDLHAGDASYNQLDQLIKLGIIANDDNTKNYLATRNLAVENPIDQQARLWLQSNCAHCHQPGGNAARAAIDLRIGTTFSDMNLCDVESSFDNLGIEGGKLLAPQSPEKSILLQRIHHKNLALRMPPLDNKTVDLEGKALIERWINNIDSCLQHP